jgi:hypothetical protein
MAKTTLVDFLDACVTRTPGGSGLSAEELYGLYLSWCALEGSSPVRCKAFRAGLRAAGIRFVHHGGQCPELTMTGPAASDYLLSREFPLAVLDAQPAPPAAQISPAVQERTPSRPHWAAGGVRGSTSAA